MKIHFGFLLTGIALFAISYMMLRGLDERMATLIYGAAMGLLGLVLLVGSVRERE